jgi:dihydropyrimidine dehydrogenase (NAD+) subunit PreA
MTERGMGAAVGQDPEIARMVVEWVMEKATIPVITKLTPNVHSVVLRAGHWSKAAPMDWR